MFDSLKDKLSGFRKDVEESTEEKAEEADAADAETADAAVAEETAESEPVETEAETETAETAEPEIEPEAEPEPESEPEPEPEPATSDEDSVESETNSESSSGNGRGGFAQKAKSFARGEIIIEEQDVEDPLWELEMALLESDVEMSVASEMLEDIRNDLVGATRKFSAETGDVVEQALRDSLLSVISVGQFDFDQRVAEADKPLVIIFTGVNGVGKTTSIAKLARYFEERGYSSVMANGDTYRAGANQQIQEHADALDKKLIAHEQGGDPAAVIYDAVEYADAHDIDIVLGDTAGRLHTSEGLMDQLAKIGRVVDPDMTLFVDEAVAGQDAVQRAKEFDEAAEVDGSILTKADADSKGGAAISISHVTGKPILFLGTGQGYDDIKQFDPETMVERLLGEEEEE
ncbi:signal recognition particle-docking protein FtsY [Haladaptatus sp.]|uniref:signal recognition particle-docking protein FtsY n=1 Tax=Haladaptatus sp. TaxID=1973141 RepID=UPI003C38BDA5